MRSACYTLALVSTVVFSAPTSAQTRLTLADVLLRAREQAPQIVSARLTIEEVRGRLAGASLRLQSNPELDVSVGNRSGVGERSTDLEVGLSQAFEPPARRAARIASATAALDRGGAALEETTRQVLREAVVAFYRAVHAGERVRLLTVTEDLASRVHQTADRRFRAGDIAVLEVNVARASLARVRADRQGAVALRMAAISDLKQLLRLEGDIDVQGELRVSAAIDRDRLVAAALGRPELRELEAAVREAEADIRLGQSFGRPDYGFGARYEREEGRNIVLGGLKITFPVFAKGQELRTIGAARVSRLRSELDAARARIQVQVESAIAIYERRLDAINLLERDALPGADENDALAARSYEVGQLGLPEFLLLRREILETRIQFLDSLLEAALARVDLDASAGILR